jgi:hypothetical protein
VAPRSSSPKPPPPPKPWRRASGSYVSADDRFTIESGGAGRWFLTDGESLDELGLARTIGPFDTLDEAKEAAAGRRGQEGDASPLADRLAAAKGRPGRQATAKPKGSAARRASAAAREPEPEEGQEPEPEPEPERTWLDELADDDKDAARAARRAIEALDRLGLDDPDGLVRRDVLGRQPAIASRLLGRTLARALRERLEPDDLAREARTAIPGAMRALAGADEEGLAAYTAFVAARVLEATLDVVASTEKADGAPADLPGWRLVERPGARGAGDRPGRRLIITAADATER